MITYPRREKEKKEIWKATPVTIDYANSQMWSNKYDSFVGSAAKHFAYYINTSRLILCVALELC